MDSLAAGWRFSWTHPGYGLTLFVGDLVVGAVESALNLLLLAAVVAAAMASMSSSPGHPTQSPLLVAGLAGAWLASWFLSLIGWVFLTAGVLGSIIHGLESRERFSVARFVSHGLEGFQSVALPGLLQWAGGLVAATMAVISLVVWVSMGVASPWSGALAALGLAAAVSVRLLTLVLARVAMIAGLRGMGGDPLVDAARVLLGRHREFLGLGASAAAIQAFLVGVYLVVSGGLGAMEAQGLPGGVVIEPWIDLLFAAVMAMFTVAVQAGLTLIVVGERASGVLALTGPVDDTGAEEAGGRQGEAGPEEQGEVAGAAGSPSLSEGSPPPTPGPLGEHLVLPRQNVLSVDDILAKLREQLGRGSSAVLLAMALGASVLAGCSEDRQPSGGRGCPCQGACPPGVCDLEVTLDGACPKGVELVVDGETVAHLAPGETYSSCSRTWEVGEEITVGVAPGTTPYFPTERETCSEEVDHVRLTWRCSR